MSENIGMRLMNYATAIYNLRRSNDLTQKEFADKLGKKQNTISSWESGRTKPSRADISDINRIFGTDLKPQYDEIMFLGKEYNVPKKLIGRDSPVDFTVYNALEQELPRIHVETTVFDRNTDIRMLTYLDKLNADGVQEALKRVAELTEIPRYKKEQKDGNR